MSTESGRNGGTSDRVRVKSPGALLREGNLLQMAPAAVTRVRPPRWRVNPRGKIVLVQPRVGYIDKMRSKPAMPLSLLHAASLAVQQYEVALIDQRTDPAWRARLIAEMGADPLLVGITCYTGPMIARALDIANVVRATNPNVPIVWGGVHVGILPEQSLAHPLIDIIVRGEGEQSLLDLADVLREGRDLADVPGISYLEDGRYVATPAVPYLDLSTAPEIPYHLVSVDEYKPIYAGRPSLYMESSRGCPYACTYCYNVYFNDRKWRAQTPERVVERVKYVREAFGVQDVYFVDDDFFINAKRSRAIIEGLCGIDVTWQVQGSDIVNIGKMDIGFLKMLEQSGFRRFTIGIETGSPRMRKLMKKEGSVEEIIATFERLAQFAFIIYGSFISNFPGETLDDIKLTLDLIDRLHRANPNFRNSPVYHYTPYPGTPMFEQAVKLGFVPPSSLEGWSSFDFEGHGFVQVGGQDREFYERLYLATLFNDRKYDEYTVPWWARFGAQAYRPIARTRLKHLYFDYMPEVYVARRFLRAG
ncbi:MAG TPA: radical SAM protein [Vicinamibacterales bacterium]|nr:radical SAM protein [Vicinamibacterales bacterium]